MTPEEASWVDQQGGEALFETTKGWVFVHWNDAEEVQSNGVTMLGVPVTLGAEAATTVWLHEDDEPESLEQEVDYFLYRYGAERVGRSSSSE